MIKKNEYPKIDTLFKRNKKNVIIPTEFSKPEFETLKDLQWECTEKIDGTNMRVIIEPIYEYDHGNNDKLTPVHFDSFKITIKGRSDASCIPTPLLNRMHELFTPEKIYGEFAEHYILNDGNFEPNQSTIVLYGEGYGNGIQKGGNYIHNNVDFILFDIKVGDIWLTRDSCDQIAKRLNINIVPFVGNLTFNQAISKVKEGFISAISENRKYIAEGLVLKAPYGLRDRMGRRLITKIKYKDFVDLNNKIPNDYQLYMIIEDDHGTSSVEHVCTFSSKKEAIDMMKSIMMETASNTQLYKFKYKFKVDEVNPHDPTKVIRTITSDDILL